MKQFTFRLTDAQVDRFEHIKKSCFYKSSQATFDAMVDNYLNYYEDYPVLIAENKNLLFEMLNQAKTHDAQLELLKQIIIKATQTRIEPIEQVIEY